MGPRGSARKAQLALIKVNDATLLCFLQKVVQCILGVPTIPIVAPTSVTLSQHSPLFLRSWKERKNKVTSKRMTSVLRP
jgi:hypothetical protein